MLKAKRNVKISATLFLIEATIGVVVVWSQASKSRTTIKIDLRLARSPSQIKLPPGASWDRNDLGMHDVHVVADLPGGRSYQFDLQGLLIQCDRSGLIKVVS